MVSSEHSLLNLTELTRSVSVSFARVKAPSQPTIRTSEPEALTQPMSGTSKVSVLFFLDSERSSSGP